MSISQKLNTYLRLVDGKEHQYGIWDCAVYVNNWCLELTGEFAHVGFEGAYTDEKEAYRYMKETFGGGLMETFDTLFTPTDTLSTGDIVVCEGYDGKQVAAIVNGNVLTGQSDKIGLISLPLSRALKGYSVNG